MISKILNNKAFFYILIILSIFIFVCDFAKKQDMEGMEQSISNTLNPLLDSIDNFSNILLGLLNMEDLKDFIINNSKIDNSIIENIKMNIDDIKVFLENIKNDMKYLKLTDAPNDFNKLLLEQLLLIYILSIEIYYTGIIKIYLEIEERTKDSESDSMLLSNINTLNDDINRFVNSEFYMLIFNKYGSKYNLSLDSDNYKPSDFTEVSELKWHQENIDLICSFKKKYNADSVFTTTQCISTEKYNLEEETTINEPTLEQSMNVNEANLSLNINDRTYTSAMEFEGGSLDVNKAFPDLILYDKKTMDEVKENKDEWEAYALENERRQQESEAEVARYKEELLRYQQEKEAELARYEEEKEQREAKEQDRIKAEAMRQKLETERWAALAAKDERARGEIATLQSQLSSEKVAHSQTQLEAKSSASLAKTTLEAADEYKKLNAELVGRASEIKKDLDTTTTSKQMQLGTVSCMKEFGGGGCEDDEVLQEVEDEMKTAAEQETKIKELGNGLSSFQNIKEGIENLGPATIQADGKTYYVNPPNEPCGTGGIIDTKEACKTAATALKDRNMSAPYPANTPQGHQPYYKIGYLGNNASQRVLNNGEGDWGWAPGGCSFYADPGALGYNGAIFNVKKNFGKTNVSGGGGGGWISRSSNYPICKFPDPP